MPKQPRTALEIASRIASGKSSAEQCMQEQLEIVAAREPEVRAFVEIDADMALSAARAIDRTASADRGALTGIPFAVKDNIDTHDLPTSYGSDIHQGFQPNRDAACVALMRLAGAALLGKTVCTEFAHRHPGKTRNPHNTAHTPGGSSSGSAAAVAAGMVPVAFGTQTTGSVIRPAAYCGVVGFKPTYGDINTNGVLENTPSFDTVGVMANCVADIALVRGAMLDGCFELEDAPVLEGLNIGYCQTQFWEEAEPQAIAALENARDTLASFGAKIIPSEFEAALGDLPRFSKTVSGYEFARSLAHERRVAMDQLSSDLRDHRMADGLHSDHASYLGAQRELERRRILLDNELDSLDAVLCLPAAGAAPQGLSHTGSANFNLPWTTLHTPAITIPWQLNEDGLPLGIQLVSYRGNDQRLLALADHVHRLTPL